MLANLTGKKQEVVLEAGQPPHSALFLDEQSVMGSSSEAWREEKSASRSSFCPMPWLACGSPLSNGKFERYSIFLLTLAPRQLDSFSRMHIKSPRVSQSRRTPGVCRYFSASPLFAASPSETSASYLRLSRSAPGHRFPSAAFAWQLQDPGFAARQTAYRLEVATKPTILTSGQPDVWDSGRVASDKSFGVVYAGPALTASTRYYWRVEVWDKDGKPYPASDVTGGKPACSRKTGKPSGLAMRTRNIARSANPARPGLRMPIQQRSHSPGRRRHAARLSL